MARAITAWKMCANCATTSLRTAKGRYKIYLIDEVHMLSSCLRSTPCSKRSRNPTACEIHFRDDRAAKVLPTILKSVPAFSICIVFRRNLISQHLQYIAKKRKDHAEASGTRTPIARGPRRGLARRANRCSIKWSRFAAIPSAPEATS